MFRLTFNSDEMAINYIDRLFDMGFKPVESLNKVKNGLFHVDGNSVYINLK
ncbi:MAG: hypothetical protein II702_02290 [Clostridia bacterium]|jgi:Fe2+ transport system protein FeoA|nr:hypothetical protein [Clostridia bacterium]